MKRIKNIIVVLALFLLTLSSSTVYGQVSPYVVEVKVPPAIEQSALSLSVELTQNVQIQQVLLHYRQFGETEYKQIEMALSGRIAVATLPAKIVTPPYVEYYINMLLADGKTWVTFPLENPELNPLKIDVKGINPKDLEIRFLSPEQGETLTAEDLAIAISLMYTSEKVDRSKTHLYLDGVDVTNEALLSDDVLLYSPKNFNKPLSLGTHSLKVDLRDTIGNPYYSKELTFNLSTEIAMEEVRSSFQYNGNGQLELRNEKVDTVSTVYQRADVRLNGTYKLMTFGGSIHVTNEDKPDRQPQNRFLGTFQVADYLKLQVGDAYPVFPSLLVSGKRVRGITGSATYGFFNLDVTYGKTTRAVNGTIIGDTTYADSSIADARPKASQPLGGLKYRLFNAGTYERSFFAIRPSFGSGENFQFGLTYLKAKDDMNSIAYGINPGENFVAGADLLLAFDNQKIKWSSQAAFSLENKNILAGNFSDYDIEQYEGVYDTTKTVAERQSAMNDADNIKKYANLARNFITVNAELTPLNPATSGMPSLAYESELSLNYFGNFVRAQLFRRGIAYTSYGNDFVQTDIVGFDVSDRVRFLDNKMMASGSFETKHNTQNLLSGDITTIETYNISVSAMPATSLPSLMAGLGVNTRTNPINLAIDTTSNDSLYTANESTTRIFLASNYDFQILARNSLTATFSIANKKDNTFYKRDLNSMNFALSLTTYYEIPLQTTLALILSQNKAYQAIKDTMVGKYLGQTAEIPFSYSTISLNARYRLFNDRLNLLATFAPSFGDFKRMLIQAGADYQIINNHYIVGQVDFIKNTGKANDVIASIIYRLSL